MNATLSFFALFFMLFLVQCVPPSEEILTEIRTDIKDRTFQKLYDFQDKQITDSLFQYFRHKDPTYRYHAAMAFASIKDPQALDSLEALLNDPIEGVKIAAAYAIGQIGEPAAEEKLIAAFDQTDTLKLANHANAAILEAVGKCATEKYLQALSGISTYLPTDTTLLEGQAWGIYRFALRKIISEEGTAKMLDLATNRSYPPSVRFIAAHYLFRAQDIQLDSSKDELLADALAKEDDPRIRMTLAIALGKTGTEAAMAALIYQFSVERDYRVKCNILRAFSNFDYEKLHPTVMPAVRDENLHVALSAIQFLMDKGVSKDASLYWRTAKEPLHWQVQLALYTAANRHMPMYFTESKKLINWELKRRYENATNIYEKAAIVRALGEYGWNYRYIKQVVFPADEPVIRTASIEALAKICRVDDFRKFFGDGYRTVRKELSAYLVEAIQNGDPGMMAIAADVLREPSLFFKGTIDSLDFIENALAGLKLPREIETYNEVKKTLDFFKGNPESKPLEPEFSHAIHWRTVNSLKPDARATIKTSKGDIALELLSENAPATVANFVQLSKENFYNNKIFHRVVPNFVIQAGCPRGDGYGSLDYTIRSELPYLNYDVQGYVGMASAGNHTECTQFFITHSPTPHLDGKYTIFAKVVEGMDVVHQIGVGDIINEVTIKE